MITWFKRKIVKWASEDDEDCNVIYASEDLNIRLPNPLRFSVQKASGGTVVEVVYYDRKKDENTTNMHVIPDDQDIAEHIGKIVTFELLKRS